MNTGTDKEQQAGVLERLRGIVEVLAKAQAVTEEIVGCVPGNVKDVAQEPDCALSYIDDVLSGIEARAHYLLGRLSDIQRRL